MYEETLVLFMIVFGLFVFILYISDLFVNFSD